MVAEKGFCVTERKKKAFAEFKLKKVTTKKGRLISLLCGKCVNGHKMCKIVANEKATGRKTVKKVVKKVVKKKPAKK